FADRPVRVDVFRVHVGRECAVDGFGHMLKGELAECDQVAAAEEVGQSFLSAIDAVDIAAAHAGLQRLGSEVGHHELVGALYQPGGNGLANLYAGYALYGGRDAFDVLYVHGCEDVDVSCQDVEHIFVAFVVPAAFDVGVGQLIDQD